MGDIIINGVVLFLSIALLIRGGLYAVRSTSAIAAVFGVSAFALSFILMSLATTLPDFAVAVNAALNKNTDIILGSIFGANIIDLTLILGLVAVISGRIKLQGYDIFSATRITNLLLISFPLLLILDGVLTRLDGILLIAAFVLGAAWLLMIQRRNKIFSTQVLPTRNKNHSVKFFIQYVFLFIFGAALLIFASYFIVISATNLSIILHLPEIIIGLFLLGIGTSLPELSFGIRSATLGSGSLSVANLFGAVVLNSTLILGVASIIHPVYTTAPSVFWLSAAFLLISVLLAYSFLYTKNFLVRREGVILVFIYIIFIIVQLMRNVLAANF